MTLKNKKINSVLENASKIINPIIENLLVLFVSKKFQKLVKYQVTTGGKRIRPALAIICCQLLGGKINNVLYPAAGLEILHNYSLIIDDIIDNSRLRRDKPTLWAKYGRSIAECVAIDYSAAIFQAANRSPENALQISEIFVKTIKNVINGEILDILFEQSGREDEPYILKNRYQNIGEKDYLEMVSQKTAALFQSSCEIGGLAGNGGQNYLNALKNYGFNIGMAFQISDDILDIFGDQKKFGKKIGKDIEERKGGNIVIYFASQEFSLEEEKNFWRIIRKNKITKKDVNQAVVLIEKTGAKQRAVNYGNKFVEKTKKELANLPQNEYNDMLREMADMIMIREK